MLDSGSLPFWHFVSFKSINHKLSIYCQNNMKKKTVGTFRADSEELVHNVNIILVEWCLAIHDELQ